MGQLLTYTLAVHNNGPLDGTTVMVTDPLPPGVDFDSASPGCSLASGTVTCDLGTLPASGPDASVEIKVRPMAEGQITNTASVSSDADPDASNNTSTATTNVSPVADLTLTKTGAPDPVTAGALLTYTLAVQNKGPSDATTVAVTDVLPSGVSFDSATAGCSESTGTVTCQLDTLASAQSTTVEIKVRPLTAGSITNQATVSSPVTDPNPGDNSASVQTSVDPAPIPPEPPPSSGPQQNANSLNVVISGSFVLISGRSVKLVKGKFVPVALTCAGQRKCEGRLMITSARSVKRGNKKKKSKRVERFGSARFSIDGNHRSKVMVPLSRSKVRLLRRLRRIQARVTIHEIDSRGHPRISTRTFLLRAR